MSHFLVLVIGEDAERQLAPYHEFECTGEDDQYIQNVDETDSVIGDYKERRKKSQYKNESFIEFAEHWNGQKIVPYGTAPNLAKAHKYGYIEYLIAPDKITKRTPLKKAYRVIRRTNPNAKWDWYITGGRYTGFLKLKPAVSVAVVGKPGLMTEPARPGYADICQLKDVDVEGMRAEDAEDAARTYDGFRQIVDAHPPITPWQAFMARVDANELTMEDARTQYNRKRDIHLGHMAATVGYLLAEIPESRHAEVLAEAERRLGKPADRDMPSDIPPELIIAFPVVVSIDETPGEPISIPVDTETQPPAPVIQPNRKKRKAKKNTRVTARVVAEVAKSKGLLKHRKISITVAGIKEFWLPIAEDRKESLVGRLATANLEFIESGDGDLFYKALLAILKGVKE